MGKAMRVAIGPHPAQLRTLNDTQQVLPEDIQAFLDELAPQECPASSRRKVAKVPVKFFACKIPAIHHQLDVMLALADLRDDYVFKEPMCQALVFMQVTKARIMRKVRLVI